jgi:hypothetical protein
MIIYVSLNSMRNHFLCVDNADTGIGQMVVNGVGMFIQIIGAQGMKVHVFSQKSATVAWHCMRRSGIHRQMGPV